MHHHVKNLKALTILAFITLIGTSFSAQAILIDFSSGLGNDEKIISGPIKTKHAKFTALTDPNDPATPPLLAYFPNNNNSYDPELCPLSFEGYCVGVLEIKFKSHVNNLSFLAGGLEPDDYVFIDIYGKDGLIDQTSASTNCPFGDCDPDIQPIDLSSYTNIKKIVMEVGDLSGGVAFSNFQATIPEPTTVALLSLGLAGIGFTRRKMKT